MGYVSRISRKILLDKVNHSGTDGVPSILRPWYEVIGPHNLKQSAKRLLSIWSLCIALLISRLFNLFS